MNLGGPSRRGPSWRGEVFERLYAASPDPWRFSASEYERGKYLRTLSSLGGRRFASGLEAGCSIGVLTRALSHHCRRLLAVDISARAVASARRHCAGRPGLRIELRRLPGDWPRRQFDLIVLSEVLYFLGGADLREAARRCRRSLRAGGMVLLVNWTGPTDTPLTGEEAARRFVSLSRRVARHEFVARRPGFRIDRLVWNILA